jgi:hypothetical protein
MHDTRPPYLDFASGARRGYLSITEGHIYAIPRGGAYIDLPTNKDGQTDRGLLVLLPECIASHAGLVETPPLCAKGLPRTLYDFWKLALLGYSHSALADADLHGVKDRVGQSCEPCCREPARQVLGNALSPEVSAT